jgi:hypothetical protein
MHIHYIDNKAMINNLQKKYIMEINYNLYVSQL